MKIFGWGGRRGVGRTEERVARAAELYRSGSYVEAEREARAVAASGSRRNAGDPHAALALGIAALAAGAQGRHAEAVSTYDTALPVFGETFGTAHPQTLKLRSDRAQALASLDRHAEAEAECAAVARTAADGTDPDLPLVATAARSGRIYALCALGRHPEAEAVAREALAAHPGPDRFTLVLRLGLARALRGQDRHEEALAEAEYAERLYRLLPPEQRRPETGAPELARAAALLGLGRAAEARPLAAAAHDSCLSAFGPSHRRTTEARTLLASLDAA
ncbi:tetratricopeptide repeat protein [Streptomyces sp. NPDC097619]|uniref:tetratricopeptide repeat protein n=1 Tax=Streptomyces sp. NPDC097619 TaxID=3157228 RepID=UPI003327A1EA